MAKTIRELEKFKLLKSRVCYVCVLRGSSKLKVCSQCEIMRLIDELENSYRRGVGKLEKFKKP